jgi:tetratricopeptide (TPR) repeat protein
MSIPRSFNAEFFRSGGILPPSFGGWKPPLRRVARDRFVFACCAVLALVSAARGEDAVYLHTESGDGQFRVSGEIVDHTGRAIRIRDEKGVERSYDADRVARIETTWTREQQSGDAAQAAGDYAQAIEQYRRAAEQEPRAWARRKIMAELVWCHRASGQPQKAGDLFLLLLASDPTTQYFDAIPLAWAPSEAVAEQQAQDWLDRDEPAAKLLGASHLLATPRRGAALDALEKLARDSDPRIAALALAQRWRAEAFRASQAQIDAWQLAVGRMPEPLRGGPYFVLGQALAGRKQHDAAALALLRVPILHPRDRRLAAAALVLAAGALAEGGHADEARRLYREVLDKHQPSRWRTEAGQRLEQLK